MHINKTTRTMLVLLVIGIAFWSFYIMLWNITLRDVEDVEVSGILYDEQNIPLANKTLFILNAMYDGGEKIESYNTTETYTVTTDEKGFFRLTLPKSAAITVETIRNKNDTITLKSVEVQRKKVALTLNMKHYKRIGKRYKGSIRKQVAL